MRKFKLVVCLFCITILLIIPQDTKANASLNEETLLEENKNYYYDLDGDKKKEKIKYVVSGEDYSLKVDLYINDIKKFSKVFKSLFVKYSIADLDLKDKKLDLFLVSTSESATLDYALFQQYNRKKISTIKTIEGGDSDKNKFGYISLTRIGGLDKIKGDGTFSIIADSPIYLNKIGSYLCHVPFVLKDGEISHKKVKSYSLEKHSLKYEYTVNQKIVMYEKANSKSKILKTLEKGDAININKFVVSKFSSKYNATCYAYIVDSKGNKGWIFISDEIDWENPMFKECPAWG